MSVLTLRKQLIAVLHAFPAVLLPGCNLESDTWVSLDPEDYPFTFVSRETEPTKGKDIRFIDLDGDGIDERIILSYGENPNESLILVTTNTGKMVNQQRLPASTGCQVGFATDMNEDGWKDLYFMTREADTVFAYALDIYGQTTISKFDLLPGPMSLKKVPRDVGASIIDVTASPDPTRKTLWCVYTSTNKPLSNEPRGVAAFDLFSGQCLWHYPTAAWPEAPWTTDIDGDGNSEIFLIANAVGNGVTAGRLSDSLTYLIGLLHDGSSIWEPRVLGGRASRATLFLADLDRDQREEIVCTFWSARRQTEKSFVELVDPSTGRTIQRREFDETLVQTIQTQPVDYSDKKCIVIATREGDLFLLDGSLQTVLAKHIDGLIQGVAQIDLGEDGEGDYVVGLATNTTMVLDHRFEPLLHFDRHVSLVTTKFGPGGKGMLAVTEGMQMRLGMAQLITRGVPWYVYGIIVLSVVGFLYASYRSLFYFELFTNTAKSTRHVATMVLNRQGRVIHANKSLLWMLNLKGEAPKRRRWNDYLSEEFHEPIAAFLRASLTGEKEVEQLLSVKRTDSRVNVMARVLPITAVKLRLGSLVLFDNVAEVIIADRVINWALVAQGLAHEMKTPLSTIWFTLERMRQQLSGIEEDRVVSQHTASISEELRRLDNYVKGFMKLANLNPPNLQQNDLTSIIKELLQSYCRKLPDSIQIEADFASDPVPTRLDVNLFTVAVSNILDNAVGAMKGKGKLRISTNLAQDLGQSRACLTIADTGCGIAESDVPKVFSPYFSRSGGGTGLGLIITKKIIEDHGGTISFTTKERMGTEFVIQFPLSSAVDGGKNG
jgi:signal transduction histidine kinase